MWILVTISLHFTYFSEEYWNHVNVSVLGFLSNMTMSVRHGGEINRHVIPSEQWLTEYNFFLTFCKKGSDPEHSTWLCKNCLGKESCCYNAYMCFQTFSCQRCINSIYNIHLLYTIFLPPHILGWLKISQYNAFLSNITENYKV